MNYLAFASRVQKAQASRYSRRHATVTIRLAERRRGSSKASGRQAGGVLDDQLVCEAIVSVGEVPVLQPFPEQRSDEVENQGRVGPRFQGRRDRPADFRIAATARVGAGRANV